MIGFYDYTVVLTYISLLSSISGIFCASSGHPRWALACLALSGLLDAFDGKVARTKKNRTAAEKSFGVQIDSLCDIVCFGVLPTIICFHLGMHNLVGMAVLCYYCLAGLIRLAWFNVLTEQEPQEEGGTKYYQGMPITSIAVILPLFYAIGGWFPDLFPRLLHMVMLATGTLFIIRFPFRKPTTKELFGLIALVAIAILYILACRYWGAPLPWQWVLHRRRA